MSDPPSKSASKREQHALQALGEQLIGRPAAELKRLGLDERLVDAIVAAASINAHGAARRQRQLIGKLMRHADPGPIREYLAEEAATAKADKAVFREAERWRDAIADEGAAALKRYFEVIGGRDPALEQLSRELGHARDRSRRRNLRRRLFRHIHEQLAAGVQNGAS